MQTIKNVSEALDELWWLLHEPDFAKAQDFGSWGERSLLPLVGAFLAGRFPHTVSREERSPLPGSSTGSGRIDFLVDGVAVELAVRKDGEPASKLMPSSNATEVRKLLKHEGLAILALFDFAPEFIDHEVLEGEYRAWRDTCGIGSGNHRLSAFNVRYFHRSKRIPQDTVGFNIRT